MRVVARAQPAVGVHHKDVERLIFKPEGKANRVGTRLVIVLLNIPDVDRAILIRYFGVGALAGRKGVGAGRRGLGGGEFGRAQNQE